MPTYIKPDNVDTRAKGFKNWFNLDLFVQKKIDLIGSVISGITNLSYNSSTRTIENSSGADAILPLANGTIVGLSENTFLTTEKTKLESLTNYIHPVNHLPSIITQDLNNRFVTDAEKAIWNAKQTALGFTPENTANKNQVNGYAGLGTDGKILSNQLPSITISDTFVVASQTEMLAVVAQIGDIAIRTDLNKSFILKGTNSTLLSDWQELLTPTSTVTSVFGRTGAITAQAGDYTPEIIGSPSGSGTSTGTNTGDNSPNNLYNSLVTNQVHTGDATGATALTLATVNANVGSFGTAASVPQYTVNAKGLVTTSANVSIQIAQSQVTGLNVLTQPASATQNGIVNNVSLQELGGVDKTINGVRVGRGEGNNFGNTAIGLNSLNSNTTGQNNTAIGLATLVSNTTGGTNTAIGSASLSANTTGNSNTAIGFVAGAGIVAGTNNTFLGTGVSIGDVSNTVKIATGTTNRIIVDSTGKTTLPTGALEVNGAISKTGGTASQFLKADGSVDSNVYSTQIVSNATTAVKGIVKLAGDLGGTADLPTTPTAVHLTGNESITGQKTFTTTSSLISNIFSLNTSSPRGIHSRNEFTGIGIFSENSSTGNSIVSNNTSTGTGFNFVGQNQQVNTFTVNKFGDITANSLVLNNVNVNNIFVKQGVNNATTTVLTSTQLNAQYPTATTGFKVYCTSIIAGAMVYERTPTQWIAMPVTAFEDIA